MSKKNVVRDGRLAHCYLLEKAATKVQAGALQKGHFYYMTAKGASSSLPEGIPLMTPFYNNMDSVTVAADDEVWELNAYFLSYANSKNLSFEKTTTDVTCDKDQSNNYVCDGSINVTGSINGYDLIGDGNSAIDKIKSRFRNILDTSSSEAAYTEAKLTVKDLIVFIWDAKDAVDGEFVDMDFIPCFITSHSRDAAYQSGQTMDVNIQGCDSTDDGIKGLTQKAVWAGITSDVDVA